MARTPSTPEQRLRRLRRRAAWTLVWEDVWPPLAFAGVVAALFAAAAWFGLWFGTPPWARLAALALFALAFLAALAPLAWVRWPGRARTLARLDGDAEVGHRPASAFDDTLANASDDPATRALWEAHKARMARDVARLTVKPPASRLPVRDPYALRFAAVLLALTGFFAAGSERFARLAAAFHGMPELAATAPIRIDAWIDPPKYAGKPPIFLKLDTPSTPIAAPENSSLVVRAESPAFDVSVNGGLAPEPGGSPLERRFTIRKDGEARVYRGHSQAGDFVIKVQPRTAPTIRLLDPPQANLSGSLTLHYAIDDAYGVREAGGQVVLAKPPQAAHTLYGPPTLALPLPGGAGTGEGRATIDLSEHPWAGAPVTLTLTARSVSDATAASAPLPIALPQRNFVNPLAKAIVELRRDLVLDPDRETAHVARALDALRLGPDLFQTSPRVYLDLDGAGRLLAKARNDDDLRDVAAWLWRLALSIENGDASQALKDLRAAEDKLRDALKNGASPEELKRLTQELRDAAQRYLAETMRDADKQAMQDADPMDAKDLDAVLDKLERDADSGAKDDAQAMLDQLQDMMENLRSAEAGEGDPSTKQMRQSLRELQKLLSDQQALRDDTFKRDQRERSGSDPDAKDDPKLDERQRALQDRLAEIERQLRGAGVETPKNLGDAAGDMADAERSLKDGQGDGESKNRGRFGHSAKGDAVESQGKAIEALRQGGQQMAQQMRGKGRGKGGYVGRGGGRPGDDQDPLGRGQDGAKGAAEGALHGGPDRAERARRVMEELRRRLADPNRPAEERDYLERLIGQP